jgi:Holliday junction resolvase-like predicted endonuclease
MDEALMEMLVKKATGEMSPYSEEKLKASLMKSGANSALVEKIVQVVRLRLYEGIPTKKIYRLAFNELRKATRPVAARYKLKRAIMELGPSGFPFERYVAEILKLQGYQVLTGQIVKGKCVSHEIDVIAEKDHSHFMIECKYHNQQGTACDVKIPLYVQARFKDVESAWKEQPAHDTKFHQGWVVTNTRFTHDAIEYGTCIGLNLLGWNYPPKDNLKELIDKLRVYPITCLTTLTNHEKQQLLEKCIVLCKDLSYDTSSLRAIGLKEDRIQFVMEEALQLCGNLVS